MLAKVNSSITNPLAINGFISAAVGNLTIDDTLSKGDILHIAEEFKGLDAKHLVTETLPTTSFTTSGGAAVLQEAQPYADNMIAAFNKIGVTPSATKPTTTTTSVVPPISPSLVQVQVLNASSVAGIAHTTATELTSAGYDVTEIGNATTSIASGSPSEIMYGPSGLPAAHALGDALSGDITYVSDPSLAGNTVSLLIAGSGLTVNGATTTTTSSTSSTTTTTTYPGETTTTSTIPGDVYTNTQLEPWNPYPCTLGAPTTTTSTSTSSSGSASTQAAKK
jgi:hypothetical protein